MNISYTDQIYKTYSSPKHRLGSKLEFPDGRRFRFALNGAVALSPARLVQMPVPAANHLNQAVAAAAAVGATRVSVTLGATAAARDLYKDGYLYINDATGEGHMYRIKGHDLIGSGGTGWINLYEDSPILIALTTSSEYTLIRNPYAQVIIHPSPPTALPVGVTVCDVAANAYCWLQVAGPATILTNGTIAIGKSVMPSDAVDGSVEALNFTEGTPNTEIAAVVGKVIAVNADTEQSLVMLSPLD